MTNITKEVTEMLEKNAGEPELLKIFHIATIIAKNPSKPTK